MDFLQTLPEYELELYIHKKSKTNLDNSLSALEAALPALEAQADWSNEGLYECLTGLAQRLEVKNSVVLWPVRVAVSGRQSTPGGATDLCSILGKEESLSRIRRGIDLLRSR